MHIRTSKNGWRVEVMVKGIRMSKTFATEAAAKKWGLERSEAVRARVELQDALKTERLWEALPRRVLEAAAAAKCSKAEIIRASVPAEILCGIYFLVRKEEVVYVGQSVDIFTRISRHRREGRPFDSFSVIPCEPERMDELESLYIDALVPLFNTSLGTRLAAHRSGTSVLQPSPQQE